MALPAALTSNVRTHEAEIARLRDRGLDLNTPGWSERLREAEQTKAGKHAAEQHIRAEIDRTALPDLVSLYVGGGRIMRQEIRELLRQSPKVASGLGLVDLERSGRSLPDTLARRLLLFAMTDGLTDWRDETVFLDNLVATGVKAGADMARLLSAAAELASDQPRGARPSVRDTLVARAERIESSLHGATGA